ncbi:Ig-like domain-containing protein [Vibrio sp. YIC-376]|uniref:Ig-like domain-containing protein n=1 Tax=Vibrio sp. YIC-376 TaxID=3136162 RepID=UPI00402A72CC
MTKLFNINRAVTSKGLLILLTFFIYLQNIQNVYAVGSTTGQQDTLVMLLNFQENPNDQPISVSEATDLVFGEVNSFYQENSYGKTWLSGQVLGWYTLPLSNQVCDTASQRDEADALALQDGVDVNDYQRIIYIVSGTACLEGGIGTMDTLPTRAYIHNTVDARVIAHELGHNLGLYHAHALDCGDVTLGSNCKEMEYGDSYDVMGVSAMGYFNAYSKEQLGWINNTNEPKVQKVTNNGTYTLTNYESTDPNQTIALKIPRGTTSANGLPEWFYIEYRQAIGFDQFLDDRSYKMYRGDVTDGIVVRIAEQDGQASSLLYMNMASTYNEVFGQKDWLDPALPVGNTYTDPETGITLNLVSTSGDSAEVYVSFNESPGNTCELSAPMLTLSNDNGQTALAGASVEYQLTVENVATGSQCDSQQFEVSADLESGWSSDTQSVTLAPGESSTVTMTVTSDQNATDGDHDVTFQATDVNSSVYTTSVQTVYTVSGGDTGELLAQDDSVTISSVSTTTIDVLANDIATDQNSVTIVSFSSPSKGSVKLLSDGQLQYTPANRFKNSDSFTYTISSNGMSSTATVYIQLQSSSSGSKGKGNNK